MIELITPWDAKQALEQGDACLIDVREYAEYEAMHIDQATLVPLSTLPQEIHTLDLSRYKTIILHCKMGPRGDIAAQIFAAAGYDLSHFFNIKGGITAWEKEGLPVMSKS